MDSRGRMSPSYGGYNRGPTGSQQLTHQRSSSGGRNQKQQPNVQHLYGKQHQQIVQPPQHIMRAAGQQQHQMVRQMAGVRGGHVSTHMQQQHVVMQQQQRGGQQQRGISQQQQRNMQLQQRKQQQVVQQTIVHPRPSPQQQQRVMANSNNKSRGVNQQPQVQQRIVHPPQRGQVQQSPAQQQRTVPTNPFTFSMKTPDHAFKRSQSLSEKTTPSPAAPSNKGSSSYQPLDLSKASSPMPLDLSCSKSPTKNPTPQRTLQQQSQQQQQNQIQQQESQESPPPQQQPQMTITLHQCPFCKTACSNPVEMRGHLDKCKAKELWYENNIAPEMPSTSTGSKSPSSDQQRRSPQSQSPRQTVDDILSNGGKVLGSIRIKTEPDSEDDTEPLSNIVSKSLEGSSYKNSTNKQTSSTPVVESQVSTAQSRSSSSSATVSSIQNAEPSVQKASRPVLTPPAVLRDKQNREDTSNKSKESAEPSTNDNEPSVRKTPPEATTANVGTANNRSSTPTRPNEKQRSAKPSLLSITDNLLRRMTQKKSNTDDQQTSEASPATEKSVLSKDEPQDKEDSNKEKEAAAPIVDETPMEVTSETNNASVKSVEEPIEEDLPETPSTRSGKTRVIEEERSKEKSTSKKGAKTRAQKESKEPEPEPAPEVEEPTPISTKEKVNKQKEKDSCPTPTPKDTPKSKDSRKRGASPSKGTPSKKTREEEKKTEGKQKETPSKAAEKMFKSTKGKTPKPERLSKDEVAEISKLARDLGCLRRSSRTKLTLDEPSVSSAGEEVAAEKTPKRTETPRSAKKSKIDKAGKGKPEEEMEVVEEVLKTPRDKNRKKSPLKEKKEEKLAKKSEKDKKATLASKKQNNKEEPPAKSASTPTDKAPRVKRQCTLAEAFKKGPKRKQDSSDDVQNEKVKESVKNKKSQESEVTVVDKKGKGRKIKEETTVFDEHVAAVRSKREPVKKKSGKHYEALKQAEMEAVVELVKLSHADIDRAGANLDRERTKKSTSKVDDIYNRHVAALKGKIKKRGRPKKNRTAAVNVPENDDNDDESKMTRIVGRKAYKKWLETQATVTDKTTEITKRNLPRQVQEVEKVTKRAAADVGKKKSQPILVDNVPSDHEAMEFSDGEENDTGFEYRPSGTTAPKRPRKKIFMNVELNLECVKCKAPIKGRKDFNQHMQCTSTDERMTGCPVCSQLFRNKNRCWGHLLRDHGGKKSFHECPYCLRQYSRKDAVQVHIASVHPKEHRREMAEKMGWGNRDADDEEFKDEDIVLDLTCKRCNRPIENKGDCYTHIMLHSPRCAKDEMKRMCPICDKTAKDNFHIWEHVLVDHGDFKPYTCEECNSSFASEQSLKKHQQTLHKKFLEPIARIRAGFESENWDIGMNQQMVDEPKGPLPLSSGKVISLLDLSLNMLIINQRNKIQKLNQILTEHNTNFGTIMSAIFSNGDARPNGENDNKDSNCKDVVKKEQPMDFGPDDPAVIASRKMLPEDCQTMELPCVLCPMGVTGPEEFKLHVLKHICDSTRVCPVCRRTFSRKSSCRRHLVEHTYYWQHKCELCSQTFPSEKFLAKHHNKHLEQDLQCLNCLAKFATEDELWQHVNAERDINTKGEALGPREFIKFSCRRVHVCTKCHQEFRSAWGLQYHQENAHNEEAEFKGYQCNTCGKRFKSHITLRNHQEIHEENASYLCRHCNLTCRTKRQLTKHIEYKHMEKIYKCSYCPKMFATRSRLKEHAIMHQNKTFICDMCGKVYRHQRVFETHCRQHFNPPVKKHRLYPCSECNHMSKSKEQLNLHMRRHTGERPYKCKICHKAFSSQTGLWRHQMSHAGKKPHECHLCGKTFVQKCSLDRHLLSHAGIKPYRCEYCSAEYSQSYPLTKHMERKHPSLPFVLMKQEDVPKPPAAPGSVTPAPQTANTPTTGSSKKRAAAPPVPVVTRPPARLDPESEAVVAAAVEKTLANAEIIEEPSKIVEVEDVVHGVADNLLPPPPVTYNHPTVLKENNIILTQL